MDERSPSAETGASAFPVHPAAELFPMLNGEDYTQLRDDIKKNGLLEPIWLCDGQILDGRNRFRACEELGIEPKFQSYTGDSPAAHVWSLNGIRRHLTKSQRAAIAVEMLPHLEAEAAKRKAQAPGAPQGAKKSHVPESAQQTDRVSSRSVEIAAKRVGVGKTLVQSAKQVKKHDPLLFEKVKSGEVEVEPAVRAVRKGEAPPPKPTRQPVEIRVQRIRELAKTGHRAEQIAAEMHITAETVRLYAGKHGITLPDATIGRGRRIEATRVVSQTVDGISGFAIGLQTIGNDYSSINADDARAWAESLDEAWPVLLKLRKKLREIADGN